jgi:hypothetical protein
LNVVKNFIPCENDVGSSIFPLDPYLVYLYFYE